MWSTHTRSDTHTVTMGTTNANKTFFRDLNNNGL